MFEEVEHQRCSSYAHFLMCYYESQQLIYLIHVFSDRSVLPLLSRDRSRSSLFRERRRMVPDVKLVGLPFGDIGSELVVDI